ncbi:A24 family peptidase [Guyparkeria halophila]|uniref:Prepilin leader peptidase/N-methyltransferase n=1 Tax=Guyparkeria halophila TaxID=47960 RepID=A0ABZ0YXB3_9GAMM|nr:A24 family peptidase [Guyparkeria halophila]WQH16784.1 A24 family peptidase [Guyparkeria halophila]
MSELQAIFQQYPALWIGVATLFGLLVGSFLNVVINRLPVMMEREWRRECRALLADDETPAAADDAPFNLVHPRSRCPSCGTPIRAWQNIPVLSWLWLRGRCANCGRAISWQYPLVELASAALIGLAAWQFGPTALALAVFLFSWALLAASIIDLKTQLLPDVFTLPLLWLGLLLPILLPAYHLSLDEAVLGAVFGYLALWSVYWLFRLLTGKEGMGFGDFKLLAALGAWLGWQLLPLVILLSALAGSVIGIAMILLLRHDRRIPIPFGPYLAIAGLIALYLGEPIMSAYLGGPL